MTAPTGPSGVRSRRAGTLAIRGGTPAVRRTLDFGKGLSLADDVEKRALVDVLESKALLRHTGSKVAAFERAFAEHLGVRFALACSSGTAALEIALAALGVGPGDEVIVPAVTFIACVAAVAAQGAHPVICDVDDFMTLDPAAVRARLSPRTKAIMAVHLYGVACEMDALRAAATASGAALMEDAAQACGARANGSWLGTLGRIGAFSFQPGKMITCGEGGAIVTDDEALYDRAARFHDHGQQFPVLFGDARPPRAGAPFVGRNFRLSEFAGALLGCQLTRLDGIVANTSRVRRAIEAGLADLPLQVLQGERTCDSTGVAIRLPTRDKAARFMFALRAEGVPCGRLYEGKPVYATEPVLKGLTAVRSSAFASELTTAPERPPYFMGMCPRAEDLVARTVGIVVGPLYSDEDVEDIVVAVQKVADALQL